MSHWNHRVVKHRQEGVPVSGETLEELRETLNRMLAACDNPVLPADEISGKAE